MVIEIANSMHLEVTIGLNFILSYLYNKLPRRRVNMFGEELEKQIKIKFLGHWYTDKIYKESGYRCLKLTSETIDGVFIKAAHDSGLELQEIVKNLPQYFLLWIDPGEVSYRLIDKGPVRILFEDDIRSKMRHKRLEVLKEKLLQNKMLNYRAHHHHHSENCIRNNSQTDDENLFLINDDDTLNEISIEAFNEECLCYFDFEFTYENDINNNINFTSNSNCSLNAASLLSTPSSLSNAFNVNDLQKFQHSQLSLSASDPTPTSSNSNSNQFNPDAESFKPSLINSHSSTSLANSKAYKNNIFSSTHNISKNFSPFGSASSNLPSLQTSFHNPIQSLAQQHQQQQQQAQLSQQIQSQQQQLKQKANSQRLLNTSIDSLNSSFNTLSLLNLSLNNNTNSNQNSSLWCLPSISSTATSTTSSVSNLLLHQSLPTPSASITINDVATPTGSMSPSLLSSSLTSPQTTSNSAAILKAAAANQAFTAAAFAVTKFGSTKSKNSNRRSQKMLPSDFSAYIKQKAQIQQLQKSPQVSSKPPFGLSTSPSMQQQQSNFQTNNNGYSQFGQLHNNIVSSIAPGLNNFESTTNSIAQLLDRSFSTPLGETLTTPRRSLSISNSATNDYFNFDPNSFDTNISVSNQNPLLSPQPFQQMSLNNCLNDFGLLNNNNNNNKLNFGCISSNSSTDSSSVGSSFLSDSTSPPLQQPNTSATSSSVTPTVISRKHSFGNNFNTKSTNQMNTAARLSNTNFYDSNQTSSNVSTNNSLVAGFANIAATQQLQTNHSKYINNNKYNNNDALNNFLRSNREILQSNLTYSTPSRPNSLLLHLPYEKDPFDNTGCFNEDELGYLDDEPTNDDMPKYFTQYDDIIECELEPQNDSTANGDDYQTAFTNNNIINDALN